MTFPNSMGSRGWLRRLLSRPSEPYLHGPTEPHQREAVLLHLQQSAALLTPYLVRNVRIEVTVFTYIASKQTQGSQRKRGFGPAPSSWRSGTESPFLAYIQESLIAKEVAMVVLDLATKFIRNSNRKYMGTRSWNGETDWTFKQIAWQVF